jgi:hypothetical protein
MRFIAGQVQQRIQQHRAVPVGQHDAVAVGPGGVGRVEFQVARVQRRGDLGHAQGHALVPFAGAHDGVDGRKRIACASGCSGCSLMMCGARPGKGLGLSPGVCRG